MRNAMTKTLASVLAVMTLAVPAFASTVATGSTNNDSFYDGQNSSLTIAALDYGNPMSDIEFQVYKVADAQKDSNGNVNYTTDSKLGSYNLRPYSTTFSSSELREFATTYAAYVKDSGVEVKTVKTDSDGKAVLNDMKPGLYIITSSEFERNSDGKPYIYSFTPYVVSLPHYSADNWNYDYQWNYDLTISEKVEKKEKTVTPIKLTVTKVWREVESSSTTTSGSTSTSNTSDTSNNNSSTTSATTSDTTNTTNTTNTTGTTTSTTTTQVKRPDSITAVLTYNSGGNTYTKEAVLNENNKWMYTFEGIEGDAKDIKVEEKGGAPDGYKVSVKREGNDYVITNVQNEIINKTPTPTNTTTTTPNTNKTTTTTTPNTNKTTTTTTTKTPTSSTTTNRTSTTSTSKPTQGKLAQTGMLWWPVPLLVAGGAGMVGVGYMMKKRSEED